MLRFRNPRTLDSAHNTTQLQLFEIISYLGTHIAWQKHFLHPPPSSSTWRQIMMREISYFYTFSLFLKLRRSHGRVEGFLIFLFLFSLLLSAEPPTFSFFFATVAVREVVAPIFHANFPPKAILVSRATGGLFCGQSRCFSCEYCFFQFINCKIYAIRLVQYVNM